MVPVVTVCPLVAKLPQRKRSSDTHEDRRLEKERTAFVNILNLAWSYPRKRLDMLAAMNMELEAPEPDALDAQESFTFKVPPPTLGQVCDQWVAGYLHGKYPILTEEVLGMIKAADIGNLRNLLGHKTHCSMTLRLPVECQDKRVLKEILDDRCDEVGERMVITSEVVLEIVQSKGLVPWGKVGPFGLQIEKGSAAKVLHRPTNSLAVIDEDLGVQHGGWSLDKNWSDVKCVIEKPPARKHRLIDFFRSTHKYGRSLNGQLL